MQYITSALMAVMLGFGSSAQADEFRLSSPDLVTDAPITAAQYWNNFGCTGENSRPVLNWNNAPDGTKSFAVTLYDQDAPTGSGFWHWVVFNIPADSIGVGHDLPLGAVEGNTDLGQPGFFGPCPPVGRMHNYTYTVHALDVDKLDAPEGATAALTGFFIYQHSLAKASLSVKAGPRVE